MVSSLKQIKALMMNLRMIVLYWFHGKENQRVIKAICLKQVSKQACKIREIPKLKREK